MLKAAVALCAGGCRRGAGADGSAKKGRVVTPRLCARSSGFRFFLALLLSEQLLIPPAAWGLASDGSTLAGDRGVQPDAGALAGALPADLFSGAATHRIPIELPPGTGGMTPELTLAYSTAGPLDSWVGSRWSLGLPSISRSLKRGAPAYDDEIDTFTLDGQDLVPQDYGIPSLPRRYHTRRESFLRITHEANGSWSVERKDGVVMRFGLTPNARLTNGSGQSFQWLLSEQEDLHGNAITAAYDRSDVGSAYPAEIRYTVRRVGSTLESLDGDAGRDRVVSFAFEARPDAPVSFAAGFERRLDRRLARIDVRIGTQLVRRYDLAYTVSPDSFRSLLSQVALHGSDADSASPTPPLITSFTYHSNVAAGTTGFEPVSWPWPSNLPIVQNGNEDNGVRLGDVDGDGLVDLIKAFATVNVVAKTATLIDSGVYLNTGAGFSSSESSTWVLPQYTGSQSILTPFFAATIDGHVWGTGRLPIDLTGDGRVDLVGGLLALNPVSGDFLDQSGENAARLFHWPWFQSSPSGWTESAGVPVISLLDDVFTTAYLGLDPGASGYMTIGGNTRFADLTGDGLPEMVVRGTASSYSNVSCWEADAFSYVIYNTGNLGFRQAPLSQTTMTVPSPGAGSGLPACSGGGLVHSPDDFAPCDPSTGGTSCIQTLFHNHAYALRSNSSNPFFFDRQLELGNTPIDLNADGLADEITAYTRGSAIRATRLNNGARGFISASAWNLPTAADLYTISIGAFFSQDRAVRFADVNGDGRVDVLKARADSTFTTWLNDGDVGQAEDAGPWTESSAWESPLPFASSSGVDRGTRLIDIDGDGMVDVVQGEGYTTFSVQLNRGNIPDLMTSATSPLGAVTSFAYTPSTAFDNTGGNAPDLPQTLPLLTTVSVDDANGSVQTTTLDYRGGVFDPVDRELRGFRRVTETRSADGRTTTTRYHQDAGRAGLVESVEIRDGQGTLLERIENTYMAGQIVPPFTPLLTSTTRLEYDGQAEPRRSLTTFTYDDGGFITLGNLTSTTEYGEVSAAGADLEPSDTRTSELEYVYGLPSDPSESTPYLIDRVSVSRVRAGDTPGSGVVLRESLYFYDGDLVGGAPPSLGDLTQRTHVLGEPGFADPTSRFAYDEYGNLVQIMSPRAVEGEIAGAATIEYDALYHTFPTALVNELGHRSELSYATPAECAKTHSAGAGLVHEASDPNALAAGESTLRCYDAFGRLVRERAPAGLAEATYGYVDTPGSASVTKSDLATETGGVRSSTLYVDGLGRGVATSSTGPQSQLVETTASYDAAGRLASETAPRFAGSPDPLQTTTYAYDALDRLVETTLPGVGRVHGLAFDRGVLTQTDANGIVTRFGLDAFGQVLEVEEVGGAGSPVTQYVYDALGQLTQVVDAGGNQTFVEYDRLGRKTRLQDPDTGESVYLYDANGNLVFQGTPLGASAWVYDALDRPRERTPSSGTGVSWLYDTAQNGIGRLAEENRTPIRYRPLEFDLLGRPVRERFVPSTVSNSPGHEIATRYDPLGQIEGRFYPNGIAALWQRDARGFVTGIATGTGESYASGIQWDAQGRLTQWSTGAGAITFQRFDATTGRLDELSVHQPTGLSLESLRYGYDPGDQVSNITDLLDSARSRSFSYDARGRLASAIGPYGENAAPATRHYRQDALGNLECRDGLFPSGDLCGAAFEYPAPGPGVPQPHAPISSTLGTVVHDAAGNLTTLGSRGYEYDLDSQLVRVREAGALRASMFYDGTGRLVRLEDAATGETTYRIAPDFEWNATTNRAQIRIPLAGRVIAVHEAAHDPTQVPPSCSGSPSAAERVDPAGFVLLFAPGLAALLGLALLQARRRRAEAGLALSPSFPVSPPMALSWRVGVAVTTAGVFVLVISIPVPLLGPGTAHAVSPASVTYYHGDHLGSSVVVTGDVPFPGLLRRVLYSPYGGVVAETAGGSSQPPEVGFTGQRFEEAAGIYHYGARWYDPNLGRFLQPDSLVPEPFNPQSLNRYSYVMNDPVNHTDPTGNQFYFLGGSAHGGTIYSTDYGYDVYVGAGTNYSSSRGSVSYRQDRSSAPMPSRITAEPFTFAQTIPAQPSRAAQGTGLFTAAANAIDLGVRRGIFVEASVQVYGIIGVNLDVNVASYTASFMRRSNHKFSSGFELSVDVAGIPLGIELFQREIRVENVASPLMDLFSQPSRSGVISPIQVRGPGGGVPAEFGRIDAHAGFLLGVDASVDVKGFFKDFLGR